MFMQGKTTHLPKGERFSSRHLIWNL